MSRFAVRRLVVCLIVGVLAPAAAGSQSRDTSRTVRNVLAFEDARFDAMVRADTAWMRRALADDLSYTHSSGRNQAKAQYLEDVGSGSLKYQAFSPRERRAHVLGSNAVVVTGLAHAKAESNGQMLDVDVRYTAVYERTRDRWRLVAWQTTRVP